MTFQMDREKHWRHKKRGLVYEVLFDSASLQCASEPQFERMFDDEDWTVYRNVKTGAVSVRLTREFLDGRFEPIEPGSA